METLIKSDQTDIISLQDGHKTDLFFDHLFEDWKVIHTMEEDLSFKLNLLDKFISDIKERLLGEKELERKYRLSLIDLLEKYNDKKEALIKMEEDKNKTPEMLAQEAKEDSEAAYRLHKKFQSGLEIKAK
jgi:DNA repair ATPase RecN